MQKSGRKRWGESKGHRKGERKEERDEKERKREKKGIRETKTHPHWATYIDTLSPLDQPSPKKGRTIQKGETHSVGLCMAIVMLCTYCTMKISHGLFLAREKK